MSQSQGVVYVTDVTAWDVVESRRERQMETDDQALAMGPR